MAIIGDLTEPYLVTALAFVEPIPVGDLMMPYEVTGVSGVSEIVLDRFEVPAVAWGFLLDLEDDVSFDKIESPYVVAGALTSEGDYLEPTIGQIWPRIG